MAETSFGNRRKYCIKVWQAGWKIYYSLDKGCRICSEKFKKDNPHYIICRETGLFLVRKDAKLSIRQLQEGDKIRERQAYKKQIDAAKREYHIITSGWTGWSWYKRLDY